MLDFSWRLLVKVDFEDFVHKLYVLLLPFSFFLKGSC